MNAPAPPSGSRLRRWSQWAFWLFLLKGLAWLTLPAALIALEPWMSG